MALLTTLQVGYLVFELFLFGSAFANNFATLVVTRFFGGGASSVAINIVGGSISDVWKGDKARSLPMSLFGFTSVAGIALGPFVGSAIVQIRKPTSGLESPWRWSVWASFSTVCANAVAGSTTSKLSTMPP